MPSISSGVNVPDISTITAESFLFVMFTRQYSPPSPLYIYIDELF